VVLGQIGQATGMFAVTNIDDIVILALFFDQASGDRRASVRQYVGSRRS
jgi:cadmium resistance protein CadD (predicted permease)